MRLNINLWALEHKKFDAEISKQKGEPKCTKLIGFKKKKAFIATSEILSKITFFPCDLIT